MVNFPGAVPSFAGFTPGHTLSADNHASQHNLEQAEIVQVATKIGTGASTPTAGKVLTGDGAGTSSWAQVNLTTMVSGILPVANGGTGTTSSTGSGSVVLSTSPTLATPTITSPTITGGGSWAGSPTITSPTINTGLVGADPIVALGIASKQYVDVSTAAYAINTVAVTVSVTTTLLTLTTAASVPAGSYLILAKYSCMPSGGGNGSVTLTVSGTTGTLAYSTGSIHTSDADYSTTKFMHRNMMGILTNHNGGILTVNLVFGPEAAVNYVFGQAADSRWGSHLLITKAG